MDNTGDDPLVFFHKWFNEAIKAGITEVNAMTLATVDAAHKPHARIVLLKGLDTRGFVFFTNYESKKGNELNDNDHAAVVFFWKELERQIRVEGVVEKVTATESDAYFSSRPKGSRIGAWASPQSQEITNRNLLDDNYYKYEQQFGADIPRPAYWGGYRILPHKIEFWQGRSNRMHDRILFTSEHENSWSKSRLAP